MTRLLETLAYGVVYLAAGLVIGWPVQPMLRWWRERR